MRRAGPDNPDPLGRLDRLIEPGGLDIAFEHDAESRLMAVVNPHHQRWSFETFTHDARGRVTAASAP